MDNNGRMRFESIFLSFAINAQQEKEGSSYMARKVNLGNGKFIEQTNKKRPGRHSKSPNKRNSRKEYRGQGRKQ